MYLAPLRLYNTLEDCINIIVWLRCHVVIIHPQILYHTSHKHVDLLDLKRYRRRKPFLRASVDLQVWGGLKIYPQCDRVGFHRILLLHLSACSLAHLRNLRFRESRSPP